jgi:hypothetical protein
MRIKRLTRLLTASAAMLATSACGGEGGSTAFIPTPPTAPTPTPAPTPMPAPFGLTSSQQFATFGVLGRSDAGQYNVQTADPNAIKFSWSAEAKAYEITVPGFAPARLSLTFPGNNAVAFTGTDASGNKLPLAFSVWRPGDGGLNFTYSSLAYYSTYPDNATNPYLWANFAYGIPTVAGDVPTTGTANYDAKIFGVTTSNNGYDIIGDARLTFDFSGGSLSGYMQPRLFSDWDGVDRALGQYDFKQTIYSVGSTTFAGKFVVPGGDFDSTFHGQFTGPHAAELIAGWQAPYLDPFDNLWKSMGGVWIGKKN